jgi:hypothetical protein
VGQPIRSYRGAWDAACKQVGLWEGDAKNGKPTQIFHDLRRSGVRNLIRAGVPERVAMMIFGHKTRSILDRYNIVDERDLRDAARRLGEYLATKGKTLPQSPISTKSRHESTPRVSMANS